MPDLYVLTKVGSDNIVEVCGLITSSLTAQTWAATEGHYATLVPVDGDIRLSGYPHMKY